MNAEYIPNPINTDKIELPESLLQKMETIAQNVHEEWAKKRIEAGWKYGPHRDVLKKLHPSLIPFAELSEEEKAFDRQTALCTLKMAVSLGFIIN
jgi:hypothetical protein